ncbi:GAF domain-containing protein [Halorussus limi]|uniref:histidine kinase n=1 Tax=Halorussus limi TaxID=2938695 RepID=A0A8U0HVK6_9EURY|nr:GAF domain-containing protein [Halorussus limi]UPV74968.1 GAF domain-containing protein [Halorussus limi]
MQRNRDDRSDAPISALYIDDDRSLLDLTKDFLETQTDRIEVETTDSPRRGLSLLAEREFDAVVCDYQMPELDGLDVLETVRSERDSDIPFVIFTGRGRKEVAVEALNLGADRYIQKGGDPTSQYGVLAQAIEQEVEHHRTRRQLHRRDENLQIVLESIGDAVITTDVEGRVTRMNSVAEELTGWDENDAVGEPLPAVFEILSEDDREPEESPAQRVLEEGEVVGLANGTVLVRKDGSERFIADSAAPIEDESGAVNGVVIVFRDVTDEYRKRKRQRRQRQTIIDVSVDADVTGGNLEAGARTITEAAAETLGVDRVGVWLFEHDNTVLRNVDLYERSTDSHESGSELTASEYGDYFDALQANRAMAVTDAREDPRTAELAEPYLEPLGIGSMLDATVRSGGEVIGVVCHEHVGDAREWTDDERRFAGEIADQFRRLLSNCKQQERETALRGLHGIATDITTFETPEAVCERTIDVAETILDFDRCVINLEEDGMLPIATISEGVPPDGATPMSVDEGIVGKTYRSGESFRFADVREAEEANPQGPYRGALSIPIGDHGVFQTVSDQVDAFDEDDLELAELLVSHAERALDQLEKERELRQQNERLDEFTSVVSHDLRNPLNVAAGRLELARGECDSDHLDDVARAHDRMDSLIEDLLALAHEGQAAIETESVDFGAAVEAAWRTADAPEAALVNDAECSIGADESRLQQLLGNLFCNAVEHGGPSVTVRVGSSTDGFYVADDGPGIPAGRRDDALDMGFSTSEEGTGFGLSIVERIAESHGWDVTVTESESGGARIDVTGVTVSDERSSTE